ncbi:uncharacterized protein M6B38_318155 [Iris pallida]|uniref:Glycosyltransferase 61 catalytic domain-containing protein n=1 Tax=Iris pallida TaxID=29817 RepID=A0AAX6HBY7_IRIPA|nr:uncharacterized protein M6B38_318155 [Iris pallida]
MLRVQLMGIKEMKLLKNASRVEPQKLGVSLVAVCFIFTMTFLSLSKPIVIPIPILGFHLSTDPFPTYPVAEDADGSQPADAHENQTATQDTKPLCDFSDTRSDTCEMEGDVRIHGNSSSILLVIPPQEAASRREESWTIKPHARKGDPVAMRDVSAVSVQSLRRGATPPPPRCASHHSVPAVVFSTGGYMGNAFHDFTDVLIPLFLASRRHGGEVQFLVSEARAWWLSKFRPLLRELSRHEIVDFNADAAVRCYPSATVGLASHKEMSIDPRRAPDGSSMPDFARLVRKSFQLERETAVRLGADGVQSKPRLLIIARRRTRRFENVDDIVGLAEGLGYEAVVAEADASSDLARFARVVNSCDVLVGVHGAGLTNLVFLPANATVVQVVPLGGLEGIARADFGGPALDAGLRYLQYSIAEDESTLADVYPKDHPVLRDPISIHRQGWMALRGVYLDKQSVRLDVGRFKGQLVKALEFLHQ